MKKEQFQTMQHEADCFLIDVAARYKNDPRIQKDHPFCRYLFMMLQQVKPKITDELLGSKEDFYYDERLPFWKWEMVRRLWGKEAFQ